MLGQPGRISPRHAPQLPKSSAASATEGQMPTEYWGRHLRDFLACGGNPPASQRRFEDLPPLPFGNQRQPFHHHQANVYLPPR